MSRGPTPPAGFLCCAETIEDLVVALESLPGGLEAAEVLVPNRRRLPSAIAHAGTVQVAPPGLAEWWAAVRRLRRRGYRAVVFNPPRLGHVGWWFAALCAGFPDLRSVAVEVAGGQPAIVSFWGAWLRELARRSRRLGRLARAAVRLLAAGDGSFGERLRQRRAARATAGGSAEADAPPGPPASERVSFLRQRQEHGHSTWVEDDEAAPFVLIADDGLVPQPGWLAPLLGVMRARPRCGAVSPKLVGAHGDLEEAGCLMTDAGDWRRGCGEDAARFSYNYAREVEFAGAALVRRSALAGEAGLGALAEPAGLRDLGLDLRSRGWSWWYQPEAVFRRAGRASSGLASPAPSGTPPAVTGPALAGALRRLTREARPTAIVFDARVPVAERDSGSLFMVRFLHSLLERGLHVILWPQDLVPVAPATRRLQRAGVEVVYGDLTLERLLAWRRRSLDYAIAYRAEIAARCLPATRPAVAAQAYLAVDLAHLRRAGSSELAPAAAAREQAVLRLADAVAAHSDEECALLRQLGAPPERVVGLPLPVPDETATAPAFEDRWGLLFVGSLHPPNVAAVRTLVGEVLPALRTRIPGLRLRVVGEVCRRLADLEERPDVELMGAVANLTPHLAAARVLVAPLHEGAGVKGKILAALAAGVPVVTTPVGAEGIGLEDGRSARIAEGTETLAAAIHEVHQDPIAWRRLREQGLELFARRWSSRQLAAGVDQLLAVLSRAVPRAQRPSENSSRRSWPDVPGS